MNIKAYKAFGLDWKCMGFQFEVGQTYKHQGDVSLCNSGFHACEAPLDVLSYYPLASKFAEVELDDVSEQRERDTKLVGALISIKSELTIQTMIEAHVSWVSKQAGAQVASGNSSTAASSGDYSTAASSGDYSTAASSGNSSTAASSGNSSTAASSGYSSKAASSGYYSTAASSGDYSTAASSGYRTIAMVAGLGGQAKAGRHGAIALAWKDGAQIRIAVGIVGESGILPDTFYKCGRNGQLEEVK